LTANLILFCAVLSLDMRLPTGVDVERRRRRRKPRKL